MECIKCSLLCRDNLSKDSIFRSLNKGAVCEFALDFVTVLIAFFCSFAIFVRFFADVQFNIVLQ